MGTTSHKNNNTFFFVGIAVKLIFAFMVVYIGVTGFGKVWICGNVLI